ncbi:MAG: transglutaminase domain-containing protein [Chloroflexi bacterium]|nr:transglutaminase domain-containing protein [Chloroflexota bacterium]
MTARPVPLSTPRAAAPAQGGALRSGWEELLTFSLVLVALLAVVVSIERADWVREMPSLDVAAMLGLGSGWLLARTRGPGWVLYTLGLPAGAALVIGMVMHTMRLAAPLTDSGIVTRWSELWARNGAWLDALREDNVSTDPLPFVLLVTFAAWLLAYLAAWAIVRWRNPWIALVPGGVALLTNISYLPGQPSAEFIVFLFAAILLFARLHLVRTVEQWQGDRADSPPLLSLEVLWFASVVGLGLVIAAWIVPTANNFGPVSTVWERALAPVNDRVDRVGRLFIGVGSKNSVGLHKFDDVLPLQGSISLDADPLLRVEAEKAMYLRGAVYDKYTSTGWKLTDARGRALPDTTVDAASFGTPATRAQFRLPAKATVEVIEPVGRHRLLTFGDPLATDDRSADLLTSAALEDALALAPGDALSDGRRYATVGTVSAATIDRLVAASPDYPAWVRDRYLQLPGNLPPEIAALAQQITRGDRVPYIMAARVEEYLRANYPYDLKIGQRPPRRDAVAYFLFGARRGYFDYHASAMAVLLRTLGVPARVAVGFALDEADRDSVTKQFTVSEQRSWAWTQVYFPAFGWVDFNPTPGRGQIARAGDDPAFLDTPQGPSMSPEDGSLPDELMQPGGADAPASDATSGSGGGLGFAGKLLGWLVAAAALLLAVGAGARFAWERAFHRLPPDSRRWAKLQLFAGWAGLAPRPEATPLEAAARLSAVIRPRVDVTPLARAYVTERYSDPARLRPAADAERFDGLYTRARDRLLRRSVRRLLWLERNRPR